MNDSIRYQYHAYSITTASLDVKGMRALSNDFSVYLYGFVLTFGRRFGIMESDN